MRPGQNLSYIVNASMAAEVDGPPEDLRNMYGYCFGAQWSGSSAAGTIKLQASNYSVLQLPGISNPNWQDIPNSAETVSGPGGFIWNVFNVMYPTVRLIFLPTSGTGILNVNFYSKGP